MEKDAIDQRTSSFEASNTRRDSSRACADARGKCQKTTANLSEYLGVRLAIEGAEPQIGDAVVEADSIWNRCGRRKERGFNLSNQQQIQLVRAL